MCPNVYKNETPAWLYKTLYARNHYLYAENQTKRDRIRGTHKPNQIKYQIYEKKSTLAFINAALNLYTQTHICMFLCMHCVLLFNLQNKVKKCF